MYGEACLWLGLDWRPGYILVQNVPYLRISNTHLGCIDPPFPDLFGALPHRLLLPLQGRRPLPPKWKFRYHGVTTSPTMNSPSYSRALAKQLWREYRVYSLNCWLFMILLAMVEFLNLFMNSTFALGQSHLQVVNLWLVGGFSSTGVCRTEDFLWHVVDGNYSKGWWRVLSFYLGRNISSIRLDVRSTVQLGQCYL